MGQGGGAAAEGVGFEGGGNVLAGMVGWVERGEAVESVVGTKFVDDSVDAGVDYRHRHCRYDLLGFTVWRGLTDGWGEESGLANVCKL